MQDVFPYSVTVAIPVARNDQNTAARGYQDRKELTERLVVECGCRWLGSGFGSLNKTEPYAADRATTKTENKEKIQITLFSIGIANPPFDYTGSGGIKREARSEYI